MLSGTIYCMFLNFTIFRLFIFLHPCHPVSLYFLQAMLVINPIEPGASIGDKDFVLDIKVLLDDCAIINLELQVINQHNWPERSLSYLCRAFDNLNPGEGYQMVKPVIHIGLLDFTLFPQLPEFYATYQLLNIKNHMLYSDKLQLSVVDLTHIDLATQEDMQHGIDRWAAFFKAATWEEIKMIAQRDENIAKAANTVWKLSQEDKIRLQCEAREDYYRSQRDMENYMNKQAGIIAQRESVIAGQERVMAQQKGTIAQQAELLSEKDSTIEALKAELERLKGKAHQE